MHELGITQNIVEIAERTAREHGGRMIRSVTVEIGMLSGVVPEAVAFCFDACSRGTMLEGARLNIETIPGRGRCPQCSTEQEIDNTSFACESCGALGLERISGEELRIKELEVD